MPELTSAWANSAATRMPFMTAFSLEEPWPTMQTPRTPSRGAPPILGVVEALLEVVEGAAGEQCPDLRGDGGLERLAQQRR